jgi:CHAT domain-containing protein
MQKYPEALEAAEQGRARAFAALLSNKLSSDRLQKYTEPPVTVEQLQQIAREQNITIVSYSLITALGSDLYAWVVSPTGKISFRKLDLQTWENKNGKLLDTIARLQERFSKPSGTSRIPNQRPPIPAEELDDVPGELKELYRLLIQPIEEFLPKDPQAKVVFVPHDALFLVPFAALREQSGKYLIEKHTISYSPSIQLLASTKELSSRPKGKEILIIGNPSGDLKSAEQEAQDIAKLLNGNVMIGKEATKTKVLNQITQAKTIHLAMHGTFNAQDGLESALDFGSQIKLTAKEILELNLKANLVVLSACSTGKGAIKSDGVIGLSRAFILAGTPRIIVSLWNVPDAETGKLIVNFYQNMQKNSDYSQSLRQAMLTTMKDYPHPRNWAAFGLFGASN